MPLAPVLSGRTALSPMAARNLLNRGEGLFGSLLLDALIAQRSAPADPDESTFDLFRRLAGQLPNVTVGRIDLLSRHFDRTKIVLKDYDFDLLSDTDYMGLITRLIADKDFSTPVLKVAIELELTVSAQRGEPLSAVDLLAVINPDIDRRSRLILLTKMAGQGIELDGGAALVDE